MFTIYMHINKINNKVYVGQTRQDPKKRWGKDGQNYQGSPHFYSAIQKYGWDNFEHQILLTDLTQEEADEKEKYYISLFHSTDPNYGYNISAGGKSIPSDTCIQGHTSRWANPEARLEYGKKMKEYYKNLSKEDFQKIQEKKRGANHPRAKGVICKETGMVFGSIREAARWCGMEKSASNITAQIHGARKSAGKNPQTGEPLHWYFQLDGEDASAPIVAKKTRGKRVRNIETGQIFDSMVAAGEWAGVKNNRICMSCKSNGKTSAGKDPVSKQPLHWVYD